MSIANQATSLLSQTQTETITRNPGFSILATIVISVFIISAVGLVGPEVIHNAAHDIRHGLAFPCH
ncbi:MAG: CbtB domain-containing protein [Gammaproteobacteria bacterium]